MNRTPLYPHTAAYAIEHGELEQYRASLQANIACKNAIEAAIRQYFDGMHLNEVAVTEVMSAYGKERICYVIANTLQQKSWDGRFSPPTKSGRRSLKSPLRSVLTMTVGARLWWTATPPFWMVLPAFCGGNARNLLFMRGWKRPVCREKLDQEVMINP